MYSSIFISLTFVYHAASVCVDLTNPSTGVSDCPSRAYLCSNSLYYSFMTTQCPATCGRCSITTSTGTSTSCVDLTNSLTGVSDCTSRAYLCNNSLYYTLMTQQCPRTCGRCTTSTITSTSTTTCGASSSCSLWIANGFCTSTFYTTTQKMQYCGIACGLCTGKK